MNYKLLSLFFILIFLNACQREEPLKTEQAFPEIDTTGTTIPSLEEAPKDTIRVGKTYIGMSLMKIREVYKDLEFLQEPLFIYGVDSDGKGWLLKKDHKPFLFVWTQEDSETIYSISILSDEIIMDGNVHVGMSIGDYFKKYPKATLAIDLISNDIEFAYNETNHYRVECLTTDSTRIGTYKTNESEPEFIRLYKPNAKIDRIMVFQ